MRRIRCVIPFTGAVHEVSIAPTAAGQFTVDTLLRQLPDPHHKTPAGEAPFRIDLLVSASAAFGPARSLAQEDELPPESADCQLFLIFSPRYLDRFPAAKVDSAQRLQEHHARQVAAFTCLVAPFTQHLETSTRDFGKAVGCVEGITADFEDHASRLPERLERLNSISLINDNSCTLGSRVGDLGPMVDVGRAELVNASTALRKLKPKLDSLNTVLQQAASYRPTAAGVPSQANYDAMRVEMIQRLDNLKSWLKSTERVRLEIGKFNHAAKAVRDGVLLKMMMVCALPEAYTDAVQLARRRLTFNKAAARLRQILSVEHMAVCDDINAFVNQHGSRFPTNIIPNIHVKPALPVFEDPVADFVRMSEQDLDEDPASELLVRLGLMRPPEQGGAAPEAEQRMKQLMAEAEAAKKLSESLTAKLAEERESCSVLRSRVEELEAYTARHKQELAMLNDALATVTADIAMERSLRAKAEDELASAVNASVTSEADAMARAEQSATALAQRETAIADKDDEITACGNNSRR
jgi:hypothetical protein